MKLNDNDIIDTLKQIDTDYQDVDRIKEITYCVAVSLANKYKKDNPRFDSGDFLMKLLT